MDLYLLLKSSKMLRLGSRVILHVTFIVTQTWCMQNSKDNRLYDKDFKRLNKMCTYNKITTAIDQNSFRKSIDIRI